MLEDIWYKCLYKYTCFVDQSTLYISLNDMFFEELLTIVEIIKTVQHLITYLLSYTAKTQNCRKFYETLQTKWTLHAGINTSWKRTLVKHSKKYQIEKQLTKIF